MFLTSMMKHHRVQSQLKVLIPRAKLALAQGNDAEGREAMREAVEITEERSGAESAQTARIVREFALFEQEAGQNGEAQMHFDRVISMPDSASSCEPSRDECSMG